MSDELVYAMKQRQTDVFPKFPCFLYNPANAGNVISSSSSFSKPSLDIYTFLVPIMLKPSMPDFKRYHTRTRDSKCYHASLGDSKRYHTCMLDSKRYHASLGDSKRYHASLGDSKRYHTSLRDSKRYHSSMRDFKRYHTSM